MARPPATRWKHSARWQATAEALEALIRDGRPEFRGEDGSTKSLGTPHRPPGEIRRRRALRDQIRISAQGRPADGDCRTGGGHQPQRPHAGAARVAGSRQDVHDGECDRGDGSADADPFAQQDARRAALSASSSSFFPHNAVEYFVSYYDYYQPEAIPRTDTYIEKDSAINEQIDRMRHLGDARAAGSATTSSSSPPCPASTVSARSKPIIRHDLCAEEGERIDQRQLIAISSRCNTSARRPILPAHLFGCAASSADGLPRTMSIGAWCVNLFATPWKRSRSSIRNRPQAGRARIHQDLRQLALCDAAADAGAGDQVDQGRIKTSPRPAQQPAALARSAAAGAAHHHDGSHGGAGIENYSRYLTGRRHPVNRRRRCSNMSPQCTRFRGREPVPQIGGMFRGDFRRKATLAEYGFRLPSCMDEPPLTLRGMGT